MSGDPSSDPLLDNPLIRDLEASLERLEQHSREKAPIRMDLPGSDREALAIKLKSLFPAPLSKTTVSISNPTLYNSFIETDDAHDDDNSIIEPLSESDMASSLDPRPSSTIDVDAPSIAPQTPSTTVTQPIYDDKNVTPQVAKKSIKEKPKKTLKKRGSLLSKLFAKKPKEDKKVSKDDNGELSQIGLKKVDKMDEKLKEREQKIQDLLGKNDKGTSI